jgi:hypothetical protein
LDECGFEHDFGITRNIREDCNGYWRTGTQPLSQNRLTNPGEDMRAYANSAHSRLSGAWL